MGAVSKPRDKTSALRWLEVVQKMHFLVNRGPLSRDQKAKRFKGEKMSKKIGDASQVPIGANWAPFTSLPTTRSG